jgi:uncharacterized protein with von Willebrand factor type A (vWA) domain
MPSDEALAGTAAVLSGEALVAHARERLMADARSQLRHGPDLARRVKSWPRMQASWNLGGSNVEDVMVEGAKRAGEFPGFVREAFARLYGGDRVDAVEPVAREHAWARKVHALMDDLPEWQRMVERCRGDAYAASAATAGVTGKVVEQIPEHKKDARDARRRRDLLDDDRQEHEERQPEIGPPAPFPGQPDLDAAESELEAARHEAETAANAMDESAIRQGIRAAIDGTNEHLDDIEAAEAALGWGHEHRTASEEQAAEVKAGIADRLKKHARLKDIMELAGRMRNVMRDVQRTKVQHGAGEISDVESGDDLGRLLPSELVMLRNDRTKLILLRRLYERAALQYHLTAKERMGRGPVVVCIDDSGSMNGQREVWAKAIALAVLEMARMQKRAFGYCLFNGGIVDTFVEPVGTRVTPHDLLDHLARHSGGGTAFDPPLTWAAERIEEHDGLKDADVVFISDGECKVRDAAVTTRLAATEARVWGVALGTAAIGSTGPGTMPEFCETVYPVTDLTIGKDNIEETTAARGVLGL